MRKIANKHYYMGAGIIALAFAIQPFAMLGVQNYVLPKILPNQQEIATDVTGAEIAKEDLRHIKGNVDAKIYLVEFIDYECYFCNQFHNAITNVFNNEGGKIAVAHKNFPLTQIHPNAYNSSVAAECVAKLAGNDAFWKYTDTLILNNTTFNDAYFKAEALKLGVKSADFDTCFSDPAVKNIVDTDTNYGVEFGVQGTPHTLIVKNEGGKLTVLDVVNGAQSESVLKGLVDKYLTE
jgi:protein-disulfide isomerase